jgi:uncharacterized protein YbaP (TraB family)
MKKILLSVLLVFIFCTYSQAESSVWKIQKGDSVMYVGGTIHILRPSDFPLPAEFDRAYSLSDMLVFETDIGKSNDPSTQQLILSKAVYTDGSTIEQNLSAEAYGKLNDYCSSNGIPLEQLKMFKPQIIAVMMAAMELAKFGASQEGVDMFFYKSATKDNKAIGAFETMEEQIDFLMGMGRDNEDEFITYTINDIKSTKENYESMVDSWKKGDVKNLYKMLIDELKTKTPVIYENIIIDRNNNWLPVIEKYFENQKTEFVLVGMAHVIGPDGLIEQLRRKGYKVDKL